MLERLDVLPRWSVGARRAKRYLSEFMRQSTRFLVTVHSPRPLAGEGLGVMAVDSMAYPLTLTLTRSPRFALPHKWRRGD